MNSFVSFLSVEMQVECLWRSIYQTDLHILVVLRFNRIERMFIYTNNSSAAPYCSTTLRNNVPTNINMSLADKHYKLHNGWARVKRAVGDC